MFEFLSWGVNLADKNQDLSFFYNIICKPNMWPKIKNFRGIIYIKQNLVTALKNAAIVFEI